MEEDWKDFKCQEQAPSPPFLLLSSPTHTYLPPFPLIFLLPPTHSPIHPSLVSPHTTTTTESHLSHHGASCRRVWTDWRGGPDLSLCRRSPCSGAWSKVSRWFRLPEFVPRTQDNFWILSNKKKDLPRWDWSRRYSPYGGQGQASGRDSGCGDRCRGSPLDSSFWDCGGERGWFWSRGRRYCCEVRVKLWSIGSRV